MSWNHDVSQAPRGSMATQVQHTSKGDRAISVFKPDKIIIATKCGKVTVSHWLPAENRWLMLAKGEQPIAWQTWPAWPNAPEHPGEQP